MWLKTTKLSMLVMIGYFLMGCSAKTIGDDGGLVVPVLINADAQISLLTPTTPLPSLGLRDIETFAEVYEEGRGTLELVGSRTVDGSTLEESVEGSVSVYSGVTADGVKGLGVFIQGDAVIAMNSPRVKVYLSAQEATGLDINALAPGELTGELLKNEHPVIGFQAQDSTLDSIKSVALVCEDEAGAEELCAVAAVTERDGLVGSTTWQGARGHSAEGAFRIFRDPQTFDVITETADNYRGDAGPDLYWYFSTVPFAVGVRDGRYSEDASSIITTPRVSPEMQVGSQRFVTQGTALLDLGEYKTVSVWCDRFSVLFQYAELTKL